MSRSSCNSHSEQAILHAFMQSAQQNTKARELLDLQSREKASHQHVLTVIVIVVHLKKEFMVILTPVDVF